MDKGKWLIGSALVVLFVLLVVLIASNSTDEKRNDCLMGCALGILYDNETNEFGEMDLQDAKTLEVINVCERACDMYITYG